MAAGDLTTLAAVKTWLNLSTTTDDGLLSTLITAVSGAIQTYLNRIIATAAYTEVRNGTGGSSITLRNYPIVSVTSVMIDGQTIPQSTSPTQSGWVHDGNRIIYLRGYTFTRDVQNVSIAYSAGFAATPVDIDNLCVKLVGLRYRERQNIGVKSRTLANESVVYNIEDFPPDAQTFLDQFKNTVPV